MNNALYTSSAMENLRLLKTAHRNATVQRLSSLWFGVLGALLLLNACSKGTEDTTQANSSPSSSSEQVATSKEPRKFFIISSVFPKKRYTAWEYETLSNGSIQFHPISGATGKEFPQIIVISQPYTIESRNAGVGW